MQFSLGRLLYDVTVACIVLGAIAGVPKSFLAPELCGTAVVTGVCAILFEIDRVLG